MERLSNSGKLEKARKLADRGRYEEAMELIRGLDLSKIKVTDLGGIADIYAANGYTEEALQMLKRVYEKTKTRHILYQMTVFSVKLKEPEAAETYYQEFLSLAPADADQYVLRFLIDRLKKKELSVQIENLEKLKEYEYVEEWAYELAKLYQKAGLEEKCIQECHDIEVWFGDGPIVEKAARLRESISIEQKPTETSVVNLHSKKLVFIDSVRQQKEENLKKETTTKKEESWNTAVWGNKLTSEEEVIPEPEPELQWNSEIEAEAEPIWEAERETESEPELQWNLESNRKAEPKLQWNQKSEQKIEQSDPLVHLAVTYLEEDDYILTTEQIGWLQDLADTLRREYGENNKKVSLNEAMQKLVEEIIDRAERRNMEHLLDIVKKSSYRESGLLHLKKEDFYPRTNET